MTTPSHEIVDLIDNPYTAAAAVACADTPLVAQLRASVLAEVAGLRRELEATRKVAEKHMRDALESRNLLHRCLQIHLNAAEELRRTIARADR
jgi:hypothetical protein